MIKKWRYFYTAAVAVMLWTGAWQINGFGDESLMSRRMHGRILDSNAETQRIILGRMTESGDPDSALGIQLPPTVRFENLSGWKDLKPGQVVYLDVEVNDQTGEFRVTTVEGAK